MPSSTTWLATTLAVVLAVLAAGCFATAAFLQQGAVSQVVTAQDATAAGPRGRVGLSSWRRLARQPRWLAGWGLTGTGALLHVSALLLAPIAIVQPIGILAVPVGVVLAARAARARPTRQTVAGVVLAVAGTGTFVVLASAGVTATATPVTLTGLLIALGVVAGVVAGLEVIARRASRLVRCLAYAGIGAVSYGFGSALIRVISRTVAAGTDALLSPLMIIAALAVVGAIAVGAWAVQQAYASGPAPVVTSALTVGDPLVAILLSAGLLSEGLTPSPVTLAAIVGSALAAATGVRLLAGYQPTDTPDSHPSTKVLAPVG